MFVGVLRLQLRIPGARSLKDKRRVVLSFKERTIARLRVSVAEVGSLDDARTATIGVCVVANEAAHCDEVLAEVARIAELLPDALLADRRSEILAFGHGGQGIESNLGALLEQRSSDGEDDDG
jgi:uncharacterized protein YlxP (DUF503 family)